MNGIHDCGGMEGFGPIEMEDENASKFKEDWERRVFGLHWGISMLGNWGLDDIRFSIERMGNGAYLSTPYYEHWLVANETLLVEHGNITAEEYEAEQERVRAELKSGGVF